MSRSRSSEGQVQKHESNSRLMFVSSTIKHSYHKVTVSYLDNKPEFSMSR